MSDEVFTKHVKALATRRMEQPKKMSAQNAKYWGEIIARQYNFDRGNFRLFQSSTFLGRLVLWSHARVVVVVMYDPPPFCGPARPPPPDGRPIARDLYAGSASSVCLTKTNSACVQLFVFISLRGKADNQELFLLNARKVCNPREAPQYPEKA